MIWLLWHLFIILESVGHWFVINIIGYDLTPDKKLVTLSKVAVIGLRLAAFLLLWWEFGDHYTPEAICYGTGALFTHLLFFPVLLNLWRGKPIDYLGAGTIDKLIQWSTMDNFVWRVFCFLIIYASAIYTYYYTDLLW
jgi:hypothetical protein